MSGGSLKSFKLSQLLLIFTLLILIVEGEKNELETSCPSSSPQKSLRSRLEVVQKVCGEICNTSLRGESVSHWPFARLSKPIECSNLFNEIMDEQSEFGFPPRRIPKHLLPLFLYNGSIELRLAYRDDSDNDGAVHWTKAIVDRTLEMLHKDMLNGAYGKQVVDDITNVLRTVMSVKDERVLVIGSQYPWLEAILVEEGAREVVTVDYNPIQVEAWDEVSTMSPQELIKAFDKGEVQPFDSVVSFSSVEHSGLGRYGDALNPWGDLIAMGRAHCLLRSKGQALIGVPVGPKDILSFNSHRVYGPLMLSHLFANFELLYTDIDLTKFTEKCDYCYQPLFVLQKQ